MTNKEAINNLEELYPVVSEEKKQAIDKAVEALKLSDEVEEASKRIGSRYYGPEICAKCAHRNNLMSGGREDPSIFCEHWHLKVNQTDHCSNYEEAKHGN